MNVATVASLPAAALMRADAKRVLVLLRPTMARFAPSAASASAAANVAPVIRICLSFTAQQSKAMANARDDLFEVKDLALDQSQPTTSPILKHSAPSIGLRRRPSRAGQARCRVYPPLAEKLADLATRIAASDAVIERVNRKLPDG